MRLALIFDRSRADTTGGYFERAARALGLSVDHWWLRDVERIPASYDWYLRVDHGDDYLIAWPERLRPSVFYAIDTHLPHSWRKIRLVAPRYDLVCCAQPNAAAHLRNGEWLPLGCDPELHTAVSASPTWDVAFVGTDGGAPRKFLLQALRERYPNSFIGTADFREMASIYSRARVGFNYAIGQDVNMRVFEVMAAGAPLITNAVPHDAFARLGFEDGRHLVLYHRPGELFERIDALLRDAPTRERIARAGHALVLERHTYRHRMQQLVDIITRRFGVRQAPSRPEESLACVSL